MSYEIIPSGGVDVKKIQVEIGGKIEDRYLMFMKTDSNNTFPRSFKWHLRHISTTKEDMFGYVQSYFDSLLGGSVQPTYTKNLDSLESYKVFANRNYKLIENAIYIKKVEDKNILEDNVVITEEDYKNYNSYKKLDEMILHNVVNSRQTKESNLDWYGQNHILPFYNLNKIKFESNESEEEKNIKIEKDLSSQKDKMFSYVSNFNYIKEMDLIIQKLIEDKTNRYTLKILKAVDNINDYKNKNIFKEKFFGMYSDDYYINKALTPENKELVDKDAVFLMFKLSIEIKNYVLFGKEIKNFIEKNFPKQFKEILETNKKEIIKIIEEKNIEIINNKDKNADINDLILKEVIFDTKIINDEYLIKLNKIYIENKTKTSENKIDKTIKVVTDISNICNYVSTYRQTNKSNNKYINNLYESLENSLEDIDVDLLKEELNEKIKRNIIKKDSYIFRNIIENINGHYLPNIINFSSVLDKYEGLNINKNIVSKISLDMEQFANTNNIKLLEYKVFFERKYPEMRKYVDINKLIVNKIIKKLKLKKELIEVIQNIFHIEEIPKNIFTKEFKKQRLKEEYTDKIIEKETKEEYLKTKKQKIIEVKNKFTINDSFSLI